MIMLIFSVAPVLEGKNIFNVIEMPFCRLLEIRS